jgi:lipopolysaccharide/colanic/teichoic acid biosynthesis glycosyltransferase
MSIIGPRPESPQYVKFYTLEQRNVLTVRPGITGPSQVENRNEEEKFKGCDNTEEYYVNVLMQEKLKTDLQYVKNRDFRSDLKFLFKTIIAVSF